RAVVRRPSALLLPLLAGLAPLLAWLYFPLRAGAFGAPARIATVDGFIEHVTARGFAGDLFFFANPAALPDRLRIFANILTFEFIWPVLLLMAAALAGAIARQRGLGGALLAATATHVFVSITYRAPQTVEYLLPGYVLMGVWAGLGLAEVAAGLRVLLEGRGPSWLPGAAGAIVAALV